MAVSVLGRHMENSALGVEHFRSLWSWSEPDSSMTLAEQYFATAKKTPGLLKTRRIQNPCAAPVTWACTSSSRNTVATRKWKRKNKYTSIIISDSALGNNRAEFRCQSCTDAKFPPSLRLLRSWPASFWNECLGSTTHFQYQWARILHKPFYFSLHSCQVPSFSVCFISNKAVTSPACSSLALLFVPAMVGSAFFHFRSPQSCRWNLLDHRAAHAQRSSD